MQICYGSPRTGLQNNLLMLAQSIYLRRMSDDTTKEVKKKEEEYVHSCVNRSLVLTPAPTSSSRSRKTGRTFRLLPSPKSAAKPKPKPESSPHVPMVSATQSPSLITSFGVDLGPVRRGVVPGPRTPPVSSGDAGEETKELHITFQAAGEKRHDLLAPQPWSDPSKKAGSRSVRGSHSCVKANVSSFAQLATKAAATDTIGDSFHHSPAVHRTPELFSRPIQAFAAAAPKCEEGEKPVPSPKQRVRVPPLSVVQTAKHQKSSFEFNPLCLQQELRAGACSIYVAKFSPDGAFFATAGEDRVIRVWEVGDYEQQSAELLFNPRPLREYVKHTKNVMDLSWCTLNTCLLLSGGLDNRIYLWNLNKANDPIAVFEISEPVTAVSFMPNSDEYFASGSMDMITRLWSTQTMTIVDWQKTSDVITSLSFSPDGLKILVGLYKGQCLVFAVDSLKYSYISNKNDNNRLNQIAIINCRNRSGTYSAGRKVSGIQFITNCEALVTTVDSRLRLVNLDDFTQKYKYKGHENTKLQISASMSEDQDFVVCGSEDGKVYIWNRFNQYVPEINPVFTGFQRDHNASVEYFLAFNETAATIAQFVPLTVLQKVSKAYSTYIPPANIKQILVVCPYLFQCYIRRFNDGQIRVYYQIIELRK